MGLSKQAKILSRKQVEVVSRYLLGRRNGLRDLTIFLLSIKAGLRAKEIANLRWSMVLGSDGEISELINLTNLASKGKSGRIIPLNKDLRTVLTELYERKRVRSGFDLSKSYVVRTERADRTSPQAVVNKFHVWYQDLGLIGCSSHSGRRTFITNSARKISTVGGSLRAIQFLAGHSSLQTTQRYIEGDSEARRKIVDLI